MGTLASVPGEVVRGIVGEVFRVMVRLPVSPAETKGEGAPGRKATAIVSMSGPVDSGKPCFGVIIEMPEQLAIRITASTLRKPIAQWSPIVEDACGEIANMIAGNLKKHLIATHVLSMPTVVHGLDYDWGMPSFHIMQDQRFVCGPDGLRVCVVQAPAGADHAASRQGFE